MLWVRVHDGQHLRLTLATLALAMPPGLDGEAQPSGSQGASGAGDEEAEAIREFETVPYNYCFFHIVLALASMYIAMLMTGWGAADQEKDVMDVGWASVWVKFGALWFTAALYTWSLVAPWVFPDRDFS